MDKKIELHYYFDNQQKHSIDAIIKNKCEHEFLEIIKQIGVLLNLEIEVEILAYSEGGFIEQFTTKIKNRTFTSLETLLLSVLSGVIVYNLTVDRELIDLQKQYYQQEINENKNNEVDEAASLINQDIKIRKHKSNFYSSLQSYQKVTKVKASVITRDNKPIESKSIVKADYPKFILPSDNLPSKTDENAKIEIISPVIKQQKGKTYKWKGVYNSSIIDFYMKDVFFKNDITDNRISFKNGTYIECVLEIGQKINETGEIYNSNYSVLVVNKTNDGVATIITEQGKKHKRDKKLNNSQTSINWGG